jgi:hypothetical protein
MATYVLQTPTHAGSTITFVSPPASGDIAPTTATGQSLPGSALLVVNPSGNGTVTVALAASITDDALTIGSRTVSIAQATSWLIPLPASVYGPTVTLTYTGTLTTVQVAVISSPAT